jgi:Flp pilus assembly protein TadD
VKPSYRTLLVGVAIVALSFIAFGRTITQDFAPVDDDLLVVHNLASHGITVEHVKTAFTTFDPELYIPLTFVSFQIDYMIAGLQPWIFHLTNVLLHAINACLVALVLAMLTKRKNLSIFAGMLFAVHPLNTETVAWIAGRKDLLFTALFLTSFVVYLRSKTIAGYVSSIGLHALALLAKVMAATLPVVIVMTEWLHEGKIRVKTLLRSIPFFALSGGLIAVAILGKERILSNNTPWETILMAAKSTVFYLQKFIAPVGLTMFYPYQGAISILEPAFFIPVITLLLILILSLYSLRYTRTIFFGFAFFLITLAPTFINFHKGGEMYFASDRYPYLPSVGLFFLIVMGLAELSKKFSIPKNALYAFAAIPIVGLTLLSIRQTTFWDTPVSMYERTLKLYPESIAARTSIALIDKQQGRYEHAISLLREGLGHGDNLQLRMALGSVYAKQGRVADAREEFEKAMTLDAKNPEPYVAIGVLDEYEKKIDAAIADYRKAVELDASYVSARNHLATLLFEKGNLDEAEAQLRTALEWNPNADGVLYNLSLILDKTNRRDEARQVLERAHQLVPDDSDIARALQEHQK